MTAGVRRCARALRALGALTAALALATGTLGALTFTAAPARADTVPTVELSVTSIAPTVLRPGTDLTVTATLTNDGPAITQPRVLVHLSRSGFISRSSLDRWRTAGPYDALGTTVLQLDLPAPLAAGASTSVSATVPAASLGLSTNSWSWGARGLGLEVVDAADPSRLRLGVARTFVVWFPPDEVTSTVVSLLVPITGPEPGADGAGLDALTELTGPGGRLTAVVGATATTQVATWALDPWVLDTILADAPEDGGSTTTDPTEEPTDSAPQTDPSQEPTTEPSDEPLTPDMSTPGTAANWARAVLDAARERQVTLLPWGDADVAALVHAGRTDLLTLASSRSVASAASLGLAGEEDLVWPGTDLPDLVTAADAASRGRAVLVGPGELAPPSVLTYTPTGRTTLTTPRGEVEVLVPDPRLSAALTTGSVLGGSDDAVASTGATPTPTGATAAADLLAELAVITRERPSDSRHMLLTVPRDWDPVVGVVRAQLTALEDAPFVDVEPVDSLLDAASPDVARGTLPDLSPDPAEVDAATLDEVAREVDARTELAGIVSDPGSMLGDPEAEILAPTALAWRADPAGRDALAAASLERTQVLRDAVTVPAGPGLILLSTSGELPLRVANTLDQPVTVQVRLHPSDARLVAGEPVTVQIPALGEETVLLPVHGVLSADVSTAVELRTPDGVLLNDSTELTVRVRAEWENIGTGVITAVLGLMLVVGLARTIKRGRRGPRASRVLVETGAST